MKDEKNVISYPSIHSAAVLNGAVKFQPRGGTGEMKRIFQICAAAVTLLVSAATPAGAGMEILFQEDFTDPTLPGWSTQWDGAELSREMDESGTTSLKIHRDTPGLAMATVKLSPEKLAGKAVMVEAWIKADDIRTGELPWNNGKLILFWSEKGKDRSGNPGMKYSDISGTREWYRHVYVVEMPRELDRAHLNIGLENCTGTIWFSNLSIRIDPRFPSQNALDAHFNQQSEADIARALKSGDFHVSVSPSGAVRVMAGDVAIPRARWSDAIRRRVLGLTDTQPSAGGDFASRLATAMFTRAEVLAGGADELEETALNVRVSEIASLYARVSALSENNTGADTVTLVASDQPVDVSPLIFGNNVNWGGNDRVYDTERGEFNDEYLSRVRPMGITSLRYPGGCNADVFNWTEAIGPLHSRKEQTYYNRIHTAVAVFGVDEYLRHCKREGMEPIITVAFLWDDPRSINEHPRAGQMPHVPSYLRSQRVPWISDYLREAPERVRLAADWVEYCNGSIDTPMGSLRARNGHPEPYNVTWWEVGNESYGIDPVGSCDADVYAHKFSDFYEAMKAVDPTIKLGLNGCGHSKDWNETVLRIAGKKADFIQVHHYMTPQIPNKSDWSYYTEAMRSADLVAPQLAVLGEQIRRLCDKPLPIVVSEYGMGAQSEKELIASVSASVMVADMVRVFIEDPNVVSAQRWTLYHDYVFSAVNGPAHGRERDYFIRPDQPMFSIFADMRGERHLPVTIDDGYLRAVVFDRGDAYGVVLINRNAEQWREVTLTVPGAFAGAASARLLTGGHPLAGNDQDPELVRSMDFPFEFSPAEPLAIPPTSVMGVIIPRRK